MEFIIIYTVVGAGVYLMSDWILDRWEVSRGERFKNRTIIYFLIFMALAFVSFGIINLALLAPDPATLNPESAPK